LISPDKIDEWIHEIEERPSSAALIIRYIANRLSDLAARDEELAAQNIELLSGRKVEEYESRIASLEYQLELLKRQLGGELVLPSEVPAPDMATQQVNLVVYAPTGQVLRVEVNPKDLESTHMIARIGGEPGPGGGWPELLITTAQEELLFVFDTGRTEAIPVAKLPLGVSNEINWKQAFLQEPRIREELATIAPIARMTLFESCIQASRRGYVKKIKNSFFSAHLTDKYIGTGVKLPADKTCGLSFANSNDLFVMVSQQGYIFSMPVSGLPTAIEEVLRLGITDHIVATYTVGEKSSLLFITQNGKAVHREVNWLEQTSSFKTKGQALLSKERREAGTRVVASAPVNESDWCVLLRSDGGLIATQLTDLFAKGSVLLEEANQTIVSLGTFAALE
jgi:DNA gyrase/topoisomerase IV subunit A